MHLNRMNRTENQTEYEQKSNIVYSGFFPHILDILTINLNMYEKEEKN